MTPILVILALFIGAFIGVMFTCLVVAGKTEDSHLHGPGTGDEGSGASA